MRSVLCTRRTLKNTRELTLRQTDRSDKLKLAATGTGGLADLRSGEHFGDGDAAFAYARVTYANDKESTRQKFILITWIGKNAKPMRKGKVLYTNSLIVCQLC